MSNDFRAFAMGTLTQPLPAHIADPLRVEIARIVEAMPDLSRSGFRCPFTASDASFHTERAAMSGRVFVAEVGKALEQLRQFPTLRVLGATSAGIAGYCCVSIGAGIVALHIAGYSVKRIPGNPNAKYSVKRLPL